MAPIPIKHSSSLSNVPRRFARGDANILYSFIILTIILVSASVLAVLVTASAKVSRVIDTSAQAFYAADTGFEFGYTHYLWDIDFDADGDTCTVEDDAGVAGLPAAGSAAVTFDVVVSGDPVSAFGDPPSGNEDSNCPEANQVGPDPGQRALCVTSLGDAKDKSVRRRVENDTDPARCRTP